MLKIASYFLHNVGFKDIWFMDHHVPCCSPVSQEPVHTILGACNGSGKSTTISLLFSALVPARDSFLRSSRDSEFSFEDYFDNQYFSPGVIIIEFDAGPGEQTLFGAERERIIVGQVVCLSQSNINYPYRRFFAFRAGGRFDINTLLEGAEDVESIKNIANQTELKEWLKNLRSVIPKDHPTNFYDTDNQHEWTRHLTGTWGIDQELSSLQRRYNKEEYGEEVKKANSFSGYHDFMRKFMNMCLNEGRADALKKNIESTVKNLSDIPRREEKLKVFKKIEASFNPFLKATQGLRESSDARDKELQEALGLQEALKRTCNIMETQRDSHEKSVEQHEENANRAEQMRQDAKARKRGLRKALYSAKINMFEQKLNNAHANQTKAKNRQEILKAREILGHIDVYDADIKEKETELELVGAEVKDYRDRAKEAGAKYRLALLNRKSSIKAQDSRCERISGALEKAINKMDKRSKKVNDDKNSVIARMARIEAKQQQAQDARERLIKKNILLAEESGIEAKRRLQARSEQLQSEEQVAVAAIEGLKKQTRDLEKEGAEKEEERILLQSQAKEKAQEYARGLNLAQDLQKEISGIMDTAEADLESLTVERKLETERDNLEEKAATLAIEKDSLKRDRTSFERFKVFGVDHNVAAVTRGLVDAGVKAMPYGTYLAGVFAKDPDAARAVFLSDPARFSGVQVLDQAGLDVARSLEGLSLDRPVVVSLPTDFPENTNIGNVILGHEGHALYNSDAAEAFQEKIDEKIHVLGEKQHAISEKAKKVNRWLTLLSEYLREFGNGKLQNIKDEERRLLDQVRQIEAWIEETQRALNELSSRIEKEVEKHQAITSQLTDHKDNIGRVTEYIEGHESKSKDLEQELKKLQETRDKIERSLQAQERFNQKAKEKLYNFTQQRASLKSDLSVINHQLDEISLYNEFHYNVGTDYASLKKVYEEASEALKAKENGQERELSEILNILRRDRQKKKDEYRRSFDKYPEKTVRAESIDDLKTKLRMADEALSNAKAATGQAQSDVDRINGEFNSVKQHWENKHIVEMETDQAFSTEAIEELIVEINERIDANINARDNAKLEAKNQRALAEKVEKIRRIYSEALTKVESATEVHAGIKITPKPDVQAPSQESAISTAKNQQQRLNACMKALQEFEKKVEQTHRAFLRLLESEEVRTHAPYESSQMLQDGRQNYEAFIADAENKSDFIADEIKMIENDINQNEQDLQTCAEALSGGVEYGLRLLKNAVRFTVPESVPALGGQHVLKIKSLSKLSDSSVPMSERLRHFIKRIIAKGGIIPSGHQLIADALCDVINQMSIKLSVQILKPIPALGRFTHVDISSYNSSSGGEGLTTAVLYYLLAAHIRRKEQGRNDDFGGALLLDNPIGTANHGLLLRAQREVATSLGMQLIYFTGVKDLESMSEFNHHVTLRASNQEDQHTNRRYMEAWSVESQLN